MRQRRRLEEQAGHAWPDEELVAAFRAGLTIREVVALYRASFDVRQVVAGVTQSKPRRHLGVAR
jgi:hypothetical protein